ncbi:hypothetical protein BKA67DRAFT_551118 [Truncatella angustata]|uniref:Uncharacterized protein n=1 Tax=Truncatella angustata TaxID=152316 RepID=A0A9P9A4D4_9PEZI|nr:uncharacterized protein BKA67DRAFT_551118 [Truncatella angustata]KAH6661412.1 hypothetical protein BKA67DRAFT_551118 [Truncatella angustata]KAH8194451.1 hypothetical protein TruAng_011386 [Truncatella angustata]
MPSDQSPDNPFVRFKKEIDSQFSRIWHGNRQDVNSVGLYADKKAEGLPPMPLSSFSSDNINSEPDETLTLGGVAEQLRFQTISSWLNFSSYSPENLYFMPQPSPKDLPPEPLAHFTFHDALEDLLLVRSGQPLRDLEQIRAGRTSHMDSLFDIFVQAFSSRPWRAALEDRGLWDAYFPRSDFQQGAQSILRQVAEAGQQGKSWQRSDVLVRSLVKQAASCEDEVKVSSIMGHLASLGPSAFFGFVGDDLSHVIHELDELHSPWAKKLGLRAPKDSSAGAADTSGGKPTTEEDLHQVLYSHFAQGWPKTLPSWDDYPASQHDTPEDTSTDRETENSTDTNTVTLTDGSRIVTKTERRSRGGIIKTSLTIEKHDPQGKVLERSVKTRTFSSSGGDGHPGYSWSRGNGGFSNGPTKDKNTAGPSGWFWTKDE